MLTCVNDHFEFSKVIVDEENMFKFKDSSLPEKSRDLVLHEGDLNLSNYSWQFGRTPAHLGTIGSSNLDEFLEKLQTAFDPLPDIIFVKFFTPAQFQDFENLPEKSA